jgi:hypothetical protein
MPPRPDYSQKYATLILANGTSDLKSAPNTPNDIENRNYPHSNAPNPCDRRGKPDRDSKRDVSRGRLSGPRTNDPVQTYSSSQDPENKDMEQEASPPATRHPPRGTKTAVQKGSRIYYFDRNDQCIGNEPVNGQYEPPPRTSSLDNVSHAFTGLDIRNPDAGGERSPKRPNAVPHVNNTSPRGLPGNLGRRPSMTQSPGLPTVEEGQKLKSTFIKGGTQNQHEKLDERKSRGPCNCQEAN